MKNEDSIQYCPYNGPAGPTKEQADSNTSHLGQLLSKLGISFEEDRNYAKKLWDGDDLNLKLVNKNDETIYVGYDRWGFVIDEIAKSDIEIDQADLETTLEFIKSWYFSS